MIATKGAPPKPMSLPPSTPVDLRIGAFQPCYEIGSGGMASVYIAKELGLSGLQRTVALKVMHEHLSKQEQFRKRFLDEARVLTHIAHPYVCRVLGFGEEDRRPYMAMEYLVGEPLSRVLRAMKRKEEGIPAARRARLFARAIADMAEGLHAAHETRDAQGNSMGVVHRDVTPQNLFVLYDGTVRVLDFGIARYHDRHVHTATTGHLLGKLPYMAPEQVMSEPYDRRVDVWALGVVLWELLTLGRLFKRESEMRTMRAVCADPIPSVSRTVRGLPPGLDEILDRALARDPEERYRTARELSRALELWLSRTGEPVTHADLSEFLNGFFPGSEHERRRWAEEATPGSGIRLSMEVTADEEPETHELDVRGLERQTEEPNRDSVPSEPVTTLVRSPRLLRGPVEAPVPSAREVSPVSVAEPEADLPLELAAVSPSDEPKARSRTLRGARVFAVIVASTAVSGVLAAVFLAGPRASVAARPWAKGVGLEAVGWMRGAGALPSRPLGPGPLAGWTTPLAPLEARPAVPPERRAVAEAPSPRSLATPTGPDSKPNVPAPSERAEEAPASATGDLLVLSGKPDLAVRVFLGDRSLGTTPVRARVPAGTVMLSVELEPGGARIPMSAQVAPGRVNMLTVGVGH